MDYQKYYWLNEDSLTFFSRGYLRDGQTVQQRVREIAETAERILKIDGFADKFEEYVAKGYYSLSTPVWTNYGNSRGSPVSCFSSYVPDSIEGMADKVGEVAAMSKMGGGTSGYFGDIRPRGSSINTGGKADGPVRYMEWFDATTNIVSQGSQRRGSFAAYLPVEHPDIMEFLEIREGGSPIQEMSIGVTITDDWMNSLINGDADKRKIWARIIRKRYETGYPYISFIDTLNRASPKVYKDKGKKIVNSNLCVTGDQRVVSDRGILTARDLYEQGGDLVLFDGEKRVNSTPMKLVEKDAEVFKITLANGLTHKVTSYHSVSTSKGDKKLSDLRVGDEVRVQTNKGIFGTFDKLLTGSNSVIPQVLWYSTERVQRHYISNYIDLKKGSSLKHLDKHFLQDLQIIISNLGYSSVIREEGGEYSLSIVENTTGYEQVASIEKLRNREDVFCVTVDSEEHHWVCNGIITCNCNEIALSVDEDNSFVCVLSSINLLHWDEIVKTDAVETLIYFLDSVNEEFIQKSKDKKHLRTAYNFAKRERALGAGVLGWHSYLQSKGIPFESFEAKLKNLEIFKTIRLRAEKATTEMAKLYGEPELLKGYGRRNVTTMAVAPTTSSSMLLGQVSPSIEPLNSNYFVKILAKGIFTYRNPFLADLLEKKGQNSEEVWKSILEKGGSVQHLDFLTQEEKDVYKTFGEISQKEIVIQASMRQKYIDQSQSLNLMIPPQTPPKEVSDLLIEGWKLGVKGFYYQRSANPSQELSRNINSCASCEG